MKRLLVSVLAVVLVLGGAGSAVAGPPDVANLTYHCHATGATAQNGGAMYALLPLPPVAVSKTNVHGAVEVRVDATGAILCPDDEGYATAEPLDQEHH